MKASRTLLFAAAAFLAVSCFKDSKYSSSFYTNDSFTFSDFLKESPDSVSFVENLTGNSGYYTYSASVLNKTFQGGVALSMKMSQDLSAQNSEYVVCGEALGKDKEENIYAVFRQNPDDTAMPKHEITFRAADAYTTVDPTQCFVANTNKVLNAMKYGTEGVAGFREGDYLDAVFTSYDGSGRSIGSVKVSLGKFSGSLSYVKEWTKLDLAALGNFVYVDMSLETNRSDLPLDSFCFDNVITLIQVES